ncbi:MAG: ABC transporter substrate-binding protein, partial [Planctomycetaceae bacterium]
MVDHRAWLGVIVTGLSVATLWSLFQATDQGDDALVVYCAHDSVYAEAILRRFERRSGVRIVVRFDTEATKSLALVNQLLAEKQNPQCDVFWNNEVLGTVRLAQNGILEPYRGSGYDRIPEVYRDYDGFWAGFAGRFRVWIVNTDRMKPDRDTLQTRFESQDLSSVAIARPLFGTTQAHYALLWHEWGQQKLQRWHRETRARGLLEVNGNSTVKNLVADGKIDCGWTDTDDFFLA